MTRKLSILALFAITWSFYSWTARSDGKPFVLEQRTNDYYNMMADGFLAGHLYLPVTPDPKLLQLADPYDPAQGPAYRMHDASLYRGKYYLYFGAAPAITLLLPFRLIANYRLPESLAVVIFLFAGLVVNYWTFQFIIRRFAPQTPGYFSIIAFLLFGYCNFAPFILRRPGFYELAIASAVFYYFASIYFLLTGLFGERRSWWRLAAASTCLALTVASRPNYVLAVLSVLCAAGTYLLWERMESVQLQLKSLLALCLPLGCLMALVLAYNYARFDSIFEFGQHYQLESLQIGKRFSSDYFLHHFKAYMFSTLRTDRHFPFFHMQTQLSQVYFYAYGEPVAGAIATTPLLGLMILLIPIWIGVAAGRIQSAHAKPLLILATLFGLIGFAMVLFLSFNGGITERYVLDFIPSFLFSAILVWVLLYQTLKSHLLYRRVMNGLLVSVLLFQVFLNLGVSVTGYYDNLRGENPSTYARIRSWFSFIEPS